MCISTNSEHSNNQNTTDLDKNEKEKLWNIPEKTFNKPNVNIQPGEENSKIKILSIFQIRMGRDYSKYYIYDTTIHTYMLSIQSSLKNDSFTLLMNRKY